MEAREFTETLDLMLGDAAAIIHNQEVLAGIHSELDRNLLNPFEQDFIYKERFGQFPAEPRRITHNGVVITARILHQTGKRLSDVRGADLLYEIENEKFGLIQYKRATSDRVENDQEQLRILLGNCPDICSNKRRRPIRITGLPSKIFGFCGCWYGVIGEWGSKYVPACEAETILQQRARTAKFLEVGISRSAFLDLFASCRIGAFLRYPVDVRLKDSFVEQVLENGHVVLEIRQHGRWPEQLEDNAFGDRT